VIKNNLNFFNNIQKKNLDSKSIKKFTKLFPKILSKLFTDINSSKKTLNTLNKKFNFNFEFKDLEKFKSFKTIAIIGMGGSILGSEAVSHFLKEKIKKKIYFFNDLNIKKIQNFKKKKNLDKVLFFVISKSGNTVETLSNFFILKIIKKNSKNIIIISEKKNNLLYSLSKKFNLFYIEHKNYIGGRYSVLSEVGIVPAYLMGININKLRSGSLKSLKKTQLFLKDSTIMLSSLLSFKKIDNLIFLNYCPELEKFLFWCQQLIAESLGKNGKGFLPTISNAPKDHHSLLQLYLDGPKNKLFYIFSHEESSKEKINIKEILKEKNFLNNKTLNSIKKAQKNALIKTLKNKNIPFREFKIKNINEEVLGELFSYFILETVIIGKLTNINPFDQPAVEQVKIYTKDLLN